MANKEKVVDNTTITNKNKVDVAIKSPTKTTSTTPETKETKETKETTEQLQQKIIDVLKTEKDNLINELRELRIDLFTGIIKKNPSKKKGNIFKLIKEKN